MMRVISDGLHDALTSQLLGRRDELRLELSQVEKLIAGLGQAQNMTPVASPVAPEGDGPHLATADGEAVT